MLREIKLMFCAFCNDVRTFSGDVFRGILHLSRDCLKLQIDVLYAIPGNIIPLKVRKLNYYFNLVTYNLKA